MLLELHIHSFTNHLWRQAVTGPCERRRRGTELAEQIRRIHTDSGGTYGSPRVHAALKARTSTSAASGSNG